MGEAATLMTAPSVIASLRSLKDLAPPPLGWDVRVGAALVGSGVGGGVAVGAADGAGVSHTVSVDPFPQLASQQFDDGVGLIEDAGTGLLPEKKSVSSTTSAAHVL